jgi:hypothetical protein
MQRSVISAKNEFTAGMPDGLFPNQKSQFRCILEVLAMEDVSTCYYLVAYFTTIWYILWPLGIFYGPLVHFSSIDLLYILRNIWQPWFTAFLQADNLCIIMTIKARKLLFFWIAWMKATLMT